MKYLYKNLYEAINIGIQRGLALDDENDISIIYQHKKIVNNSNAISYYVDDLLQDSDIEYNYKQIIKYYIETGYKYKVKDFKKLKTIFNKIKKFKNVSFEWIENMKDYISIVLEDDTEINFYEKSDKKPLFLKFANDDIVNTENKILIYLYEKHHIPKEVYQWQTKEVQIQDDEYLINMDKYRNWENVEKEVNKDLSEYENCLRIQNIVQGNPNKYGEIPAIDYCLNLNDINGYQGYLPSIWQLKIMHNNIDMINYIFKYLNLKKINELNKSSWWSSTESRYNYSWNLYYGNTYNTNKVFNNFRIFPLFAQIKIKV
ncbi:MAG: hypothetical protein [Wendovervirus sonii]|uniref:DUF1566 domain-containing protein n=1 Tax=phage Lak_Megaphage_Sonny TaxID=3109229 RepID=A0ABZ0Z7B3_9CAUD|nr:MAG: hypothetical protein [phage Lak_Megaphage_Sonny]